jgi:citrate synthase
MQMLEEMGSVDAVEPWVLAAFERKERLMGFGHRVYKTYDPRAKILKELAADLAKSTGDTKWYDMSEIVERVVMEQKGLYPNVDFYAATVYHSLGIPTDLMTPIFALARMAGWTAHVREQYADNRLIRPESEYIGPRDQKYVPIEERP